MVSHRSGKGEIGKVSESDHSSDLGYKGRKSAGRDNIINMHFSLVLFCAAAAAVAIAAPTGEEKDHAWISKISAEGKKAIKEVSEWNKRVSPRILQMEIKNNKLFSR